MSFISKLCVSFLGDVSVMKKVFVGILACVCLFGTMSYAKEPTLTAFDVVVLDKTRGKVLHQESFVLSPAEDGGNAVKPIYQIGDFMDGLQFSLMLYQKKTYEAFISPVPDGKIVSTGKLSSKPAEVFLKWKGTDYTLSVVPK